MGMFRTAAILAAGTLCGALGTWWLIGHPDNAPATVPVRDLVESATMSPAQADAHRRSRYADIRTVEDVLALPTDFAETEALYVMAGRASSAELQYLLEQANRIRDHDVRTTAQRILLGRLAEIDPRSALVFARQPGFADEPALLDSVWATWAKLDLDGALDLAAGLADRERRAAAESLYIALGTTGDTAARVEADLGEAPAYRSQRAHVLRLARTSVVDAARYIDDLRWSQDKNALIEELARAVVERGMAPDSATVASTDSRFVRIYEQQVARYRAQIDPETALQQALANGNGQRNRIQVVQAISALAQRDPAAAETYLSQLTNRQDRENVIGTIASGIAEDDPDRALAWLAEQGLMGSRDAMASVISAIARSDPTRAFLEIENLPDPRIRSQVTVTIGLQLAGSNPDDVRDVVESIGDKAIRQELLQRLGSSWARIDHREAFAWAASLAAADRRVVEQAVVGQLVSTDVDAAMSAVARLPIGNQQHFRPQIARQLAEQRSLAEAEAYIARFEGDPDYPQLQAALVAAMIQSDPQRAQQQLAFINDPALKDQLRMGLLPRLVAIDERQAIRMYAEIDDPEVKRHAGRQFLEAYHTANPNGALSWLNALPAGRDRDMGFATMAGREGNSPETAREYLDRIDDEEIRHRARLQFVFSLARYDPQGAREYLDSIDHLTDDERARYEGLLNQMNRAISVY